ncbi:ammonium transporter Rh type B-like isoform X2 [Acanthaster planci]|uniref:Ammonium transporter Rh type B-like isoform X2 n=1 Tax=Acanthaster planci TaxID=133434 RepID=A0A8B7ZPB0_ACAPL|nr:ammonium transporter Rh type B-like isoform X2 [Acanthaster planci]
MTERSVSDQASSFQPLRNGVSPRPNRKMAWTRGKLTLLLLVLQVVFLVLFGVLVEYDPSADARKKSGGHGEAEGENLAGFSNQVDLYYPMFQDVHVMMFIGFGFLMTFLKKYGYGSAGFNFLIAAFVLEWATLMRGFLELAVKGEDKIHVNIQSMLTADFTSAVVLISFGAVLGKTSPVQLIVMAFFEVVLALVNEHIGLEIFGTVDVGGSMFVHVFGAYFGLAVARVLARDATEDNENEGATYHSDIFSLIGTIFLWLFWPSFNSALALEDARHRAVLNTYFSLAACCVVTFAITTLLNKDGKVEMVHIQNATLAGGVAVGTSADLMIQPWGAILIGIVAAMLSTVGYKYIQPFLASKLKLHDTCGVHNLHGMPGILAAFAGAIAAATATKERYGDNLYKIFEARATNGSMNTAEDFTGGMSHVMESPRSASGQAGYQLAALAVTLAIAIVGGVITGLIMKIPIWNEPEDDELYEDKPFWDIDKSEVEYHEVSTGDIPMKKYAKDGNNAEAPV